MTLGLGENDLGGWQISDRTSDIDLFFHDNTIYMDDNGVPVTILDNVAPIHLAFNIPCLTNCSSAM